MPRRNNRNYAEFQTPKPVNGIRCDKPMSSEVHHRSRSAGGNEPSPTVQESCKDYPRSITCTRRAYQRANVSVPVSVKPFSFAGPTNTLCCSDPVIKNIRCVGKNDRVCYFTISQEICVEVPIHFGAEACVGLPAVECLEVSVDDCSDCEETPDEHSE